ncbi:MAG: hypothetical protein ACRD04_07805 [Terriglobales bacterium]
MPWFGIVLYLHLIAVVAAFAFASFIHLGLEHMWAAETAPEALAALRLTARGGSKMPWVGLALLLTGAYLTQAAFRWTAPWIDVSILGLVVLEAVGGISGARRQRLAATLGGGTSPTPLSAAQRAALRDPFSRMANYMLPLLTLGIMLVMVLKPGVAGSVAMLVIAAGAGAGLGLGLKSEDGHTDSDRRPSPAAADK